MGRFPRGSSLKSVGFEVLAVAVAVAVVLLVFVVEPKEWELDWALGPAVDEEEALCLWDFLYLEPAKPGRVGSSSIPGFFDSMTTTRRMVGRNCGSDWVHNNPIWMHFATCSRSAEDANVGSKISRLLPLL